MVDFHGFHVGKYTSPMDGMGMVWVWQAQDIQATRYAFAAILGDGSVATWGPMAIYQVIFLTVFFWGF